MKQVWMIAAAAMGWSLAAAPLPAAADAQSDQVRAACMADYKHFCFGTMPGGGRILACLGQHMAELAPPCAQAVSMGAACVEDYKKYCANASPKNGELKRCLEQQGPKLSPNCARTLTSIR